MANYTCNSTGRYKKVAITGLGIGMANFLLILLRWPEEPSFWELAYIFCASIGTSGLLATQFVGLSASVPKGMTATTTTAYYLSQQFGMMIGVTLTAAVNRRIFQHLLKQNLGTSAEALRVRNKHRF